MIFLGNLVESVSSSSIAKSSESSSSPFVAVFFFVLSFPETLRLEGVLLLAVVVFSFVFVSPIWVKRLRIFAISAEV